MKFVCGLHPNIAVSIKGKNYQFINGVYEHPVWDKELYEVMVGMEFIHAEDTSTTTEEPDTEEPVEEPDTVDNSTEDEVTTLSNSVSSKQVRVFASRQGISIPRNLTTKQEQIDHINSVLANR